ncbi:MAG: recombinase family protein [Eubacteriales bacterium]|nr:recombinase family protein [Eubacteriales bacterium]
MRFTLQSNHTKIANEMCRLRRVNASGKIKWTCGVISRIISNPTYMGYMAYGKSFSNNYLEQKRVNNNNKSSYMYVKCDFPSIVSEEEWREAEAIRLRRRRELKVPEAKVRTPLDPETMTAAKRETHDLWAKKLQCSCGSSFRKNRWHKNKNKDWSYGYQCYNQLNNGSTKKRRSQSLDDSGYCDAQMIADWKLEVMGKILLEKLWIDKKDAVQTACEILKSCIVSDKASQKDTAAIQAKIERVKQKINNLVDLRTEGDVSKDEYRLRRKKLDDDIAAYEQEIKTESMENTPKQKESLSHLNKLEEALNEMTDFSEGMVDRDIFNKFVGKVIPVSNNRFAWYMNLDGSDPYKFEVTAEGRKNNSIIRIDEPAQDNKEDSSSVHNDEIFYLSDICYDSNPSILPTPYLQQLSGKTKKIEKKSSLVPMQHRLLYVVGRTNLYFEFTVDYEAAKAFRKANGDYLREFQWTDLTVEVYI